MKTNDRTKTTRFKITIARSLLARVKDAARQDGISAAELVRRVAIVKLAA